MCMFEAHPELGANAACRTSWARLTGCLSDDVGHEKLLALLRVVVVLSPGTHIVRIWFVGTEASTVCTSAISKRKGKIFTVHGGWDRNGPRAASIHVAKRKRK